MANSFPDTHHTIDETIIADDKVIARWHGHWHTLLILTSIGFSWISHHLI